MPTCSLELKSQSLKLPLHLVSFFHFLLHNIIAQAVGRENPTRLQPRSSKHNIFLDGVLVRVSWSEAGGKRCLKPYIRHLWVYSVVPLTRMVAVASEGLESQDSSTLVFHDQAIQQVVTCAHMCACW